MGSIDEHIDVSNKLFDTDSIASAAFWEIYIRGRPRVPSSLFTRIYNYHKSHGGEFGIVNDIGAGVGNLSSELAKRFTEVIVTESNIKSLELARKHLIPGGTFRARYRFVNGRAEDHLLEPGSVDMAFAANLMHWVELEPALIAIAEQLKPGGTFFAGLWGMSILLDKEADDIWIRIMDVINIHCAKAFLSERLRQILEIQDSGYDAIPLTEDVWYPGVQRVKLNASEDAFRAARAWKDDYPLLSKVGPTDKTTFEEDHDWCFETDLDGLKAQAGSWPVRPAAEIMDPLWQEMESVLANGKCGGYFPASLILATKK